MGRARVDPRRVTTRSSRTRKSFALHRERQVADLVEEDRSAAGRLEQPGARRHGTGERALLAAEELALEQRLGQGRAVDAHEGTLRPRRLRVNGARQDLLADPRLAEQQDADRRPRRAHRLLVEGAHGGVAQGDAAGGAARRLEVEDLALGRMPHDQAGGAEQDPLADRQVGLSANQLPHVQRLVPGPGARLLADEDSVGAAQVLDLQTVAHAQDRVLARDGRIVDANRAPFTATDGHLAGRGKVEGPDLLAQEHGQLERHGRASIGRRRQRRGRSACARARAPRETPAGLRLRRP